MDLSRFLRRLGNRARLSPSPSIRHLFAFARWSYRRLGRLLPFLHLGWMASLRRARWDGDDLLLEGWAFVRGVEYGPRPDLELWLQRGRQRVAATVEQVMDTDIRGGVPRAELDYAADGFSARLDGNAMSRLGDGTGDWRMRVAIGGRGNRSVGPLRSLNRFGSPVAVPLRRFGARLVGPVHHPRKGVLVTARDVTAEVERTIVERRDIHLRVHAYGPFDAARLAGPGQDVVDLMVARVGDAWELSGTLPNGHDVVDELTGQQSPPTWQAEVRTGRRWSPLVASPGAGVRPTEGSPVLVRPAPSQALEIVEVPVHVEVTALEHVDGERPVLRIEATVAGATDDLDLEMVAPRLRVPVSITRSDGDHLEAEVPLHVSMWGGPELPIMRGAYALVVRRDHEDVRTFVAPSVVDRLAEVVSGPRQRLRLELDRRDQLRMRVTRPRSAVEHGSYNQARLFEEYALQRLEPLDAVYLESFFGRNATCNPRALDREIAQRFPNLPRYWAVDDFSIPVPEGSHALVIGTRDWWRVRESARWIVTNEWLRTRYVKKPYQTVLQTWHGSMYKQIGLDRSGKGRAHLDLARRERDAWDLFVSQNGDTTPIIGRAYAFESGVIETGYPRNDELAGAGADRVAEIRKRLGIDADTTVVMYAPTWREVGQEVQLLDLVELSAQLGPGYTLLQRGHVRTLSLVDAMEADGVIDVGTYPQINDLYLAADVLVTDYSSMMFDFSVTRKPMVFFTPDLEEYTDPKVRGVYFDLEEVAPGPVVRTPREVVSLLQNIDAWVPDYAERYDAWSKRFNHADDGHASARAVDELFAFDPLAAHEDVVTTRFDAGAEAAGEDD